MRMVVNISLATKMPSVLSHGFGTTISRLMSESLMGVFVQIRRRRCAVSRLMCSLSGL
jgi:hypothetical protein